MENKEEYPPTPERLPIVVGDHVQLKSGNVAEVLAIRGKQLELRLGGLLAKVKRSEVVKVSPTPLSKETKAPPSYLKGIDLCQRTISFDTTLVIRKMQPEIALSLLEPYIDQAVMLGVEKVRILHGKGQGILRDLVRNTLKDHPKVTRMHDEHPSYGGSGFTVVIFDVS